MALKAGRVGVNPNYVDKEGRPLYDNSYLKELLRKEGIITLFTKEGNPISIDNAVEGHLYSCIVTLSPKQAGSGTPAPDNERAITGFDTLKITANSVDTDYSFDNTVYGGVLDVSTGVLAITEILITYDGSEDENWTVYAAEQRAIIAAPSGTELPASATTVYDVLCNYLPPVAFGDVYEAKLQGIACSIGGNISIHIDGVTDTGTATLAELRTYLSSHNLTVCYKLVTPTSIELTPAQIALVTGSNTVTSTTGTSLDIQYLGTLVPGGANGRSLNRSLNLNREVIGTEERKEIQEEIKEEVKEVPVEEPVTVKKSTKKSTK